MISRLFSSPLFRRLLCCLLALATVCLCLAPALVQPALALAGVDDATLAVGLLFCSWAGVTFATNQGAATAVTSFLNSSVNGLKACSEVASKYVVDGSLALVQGVKDAFASILSDINTRFKTDADTNTGVFCDGLSEGLYALPYFDNLYNNPSFDDSQLVTYCFIPYSSNLKFRYVTVDSTGNYTYYGFLPTSAYSYLGGTSFGFVTYLKPSGYKGITMFVLLSDGSVSGVGSSFPERFESAYVEIQPVSADNSQTFNRSKEIDGTQIQEITFAPGGVWEPSPDDPTQPDMSQWPGLSLAALLAILANQNSNNPNLDPEKMIEELRQALNGGSGGCDGPTVTDPTTPPTDPGSSGDVTDAPPEFNNMLLPGLKDFFPFCIPFDIYNMMGALCADPVAPKFTFATSFLGQVYSVDIDLSPWDNVAVVVRYMVVAIYIVALAVATRKFIKW